MNETIYIVPNLEYLQKLSHLYNVSIDYITGNSDYTKIGNKEMSPKTGLSNDAIDALHMLHTPLNQIGQYIDSDSANFGTKTPVFRQNENTFIFSPGDVAEEIFKTRIYDSLKQLKERYSLDIIIRGKENSEYFDKCFNNYINNSNNDKH